MHALDYLIITAYFGVVIYIGLRVRGSVHSGEDFFLSGRSLPAITTGLAYVAANMGSFELMGASATGAKYGMFATQLSWIGCVPAMIFSGLVMARFFYGSKARSVPEYLGLRFDEKTRALNAINFAFLTIFTSGLSLYGLAIVFQALFHWPIDLSIWVSAGTVLTYVYLGGLRASIYTEVLQFFLIVVGTLPLSVIVLTSLGGFSGLLRRLPANMAHTWTPVLHPQGTAYGGGPILCRSVHGGRQLCLLVHGLPGGTKGSGSEKPGGSPEDAAYSHLPQDALACFDGSSGIGRPNCNPRTDEGKLQHGDAVDVSSLLPGGVGGNCHDSVALQFYVRNGRQRDGL